MSKKSVLYKLYDVPQTRRDEFFFGGGKYTSYNAPARLSRKDIRNELEELVSAGVYPSGAIELQIISVAAWVVIEHPKRKEIRKRLRQLSAEAYCVDKVLAERIDQIADRV